MLPSAWMLAAGDQKHHEACCASFDLITAAAWDSPRHGSSGKKKRRSLTMAMCIDSSAQQGAPVAQASSGCAADLREGRRSS